MIVMKSVLGPATYTAGVGFPVTIGELEKVEHLGSGFVGGTFTGSGIKAGVFANTSCHLFPLVTKVSGNVLGVECFTASGLNADATVLLATVFAVIAEGY